jgi:succinyl-CoA synthetase beta subunit
MKIHEYQGKELLAAAGAATSRGVVVSTPEEAVKAFDQVGGPVVLKAQIHAGGRGKGGFAGSGFLPGDPKELEGIFPTAGVTPNAEKLGGVKFIKKREDVQTVAEVMFKYPLVTKQTGAEGQKVRKVLVVQASAKIVREVYVGMVLDRAIGKPILMGCGEGGVDIEEVAAKSPEKILKIVVDPTAGLQPYQARTMAFALKDEKGQPVFTGEEVPQAEKIFHALAKVYLEKDCTLAEINPLGVMSTGEVVAVDAKFSFDDNALFRHPDIAALRDEAEEDPAELRAAQTGLSYISLTGNIGCLVNGAGLAMSTMDIIKHHGGTPANFLDVGGGANEKQVTEAFRILLGDRNVKAVLVNIFGGIMKCDIIAAAIINAFKEVGFHVPLVVRLEGTNVEQGKKMLADSGLPILTADGLTQAAQKVVAAAKG